MKILLTGGSGFIGKNIKESFLNEKYHIYAPSRKELDCFNDQSVEDFFSKNSFDIVIHSACKPGHRNAKDSKDLLFTNSRMTFNLLKYQNSWGKFINLGSGAIYGMNHYQPKMKEEYFGTHVPDDEHGYNKYIFGLLFPNYNNVIDFRIFSIFGKYEDYAIRFLSNAICKAIFDLPITIKQNRKFDFLFIDDLMPILDHFILHDANHSEYNISPDNSIELLDAAKTIRVISGKDIEIKIANQGLGLEYSGDNTRLRNEIKNLPLTQLEKAIEQLYNWYHKNVSTLNKEVLLFDK